MNNKLILETTGLWISIAIFSILIFLIITKEVVYGIFLIIIAIISGAFLQALIPSSSKIRNFYGVAMFVGIIVSILVATAAYLENIPRNDDLTIHSFKDMKIYLEITSPLIVPIKNVVIDENTDVKLTIYPNVSDINIESIAMNLPRNPILFPNNGFEKIVEDKDDKISGETKDKISYLASFKVIHDGQVRNSSYSNDLIISYYSGNSSNLYEHIISFKWNIITKDLNQLIYFAIIFTAVLISRIISLMLVRLEAKKGQSNVSREYLVKIDHADYIWIFLSFLIPLFIFIPFTNQVEMLTKVVMLNIIIAFGFGYTFEKVLEEIKQFKDLKS